MLKIITATHRLFFSKESTILVISIDNKSIRKNIGRRGRKTSERHKTSEGGGRFRGIPYFQIIPFL